MGKNAAVEHIGALLGHHFMLVADRRYLVGNFNSHLEHCLFLTLDEAFWSGDKQTEGILKNLVTGRKHIIEHKGKEPYAIANLTRVAILGNEEWLVPATHDERRFAVFDVGEARRQDRVFFRALQEGLNAGGYARLLGYLKSHIIDTDVNAAPDTEALADQKHASLDFFHQWWLACITEGRIQGSDFHGDWPATVVCETLRNAFRRYTRERANKISRLPDDLAFGRLLKRVCPTIVKARGRLQDGSQPWAYKVPQLGECRALWDKFIGHGMAWE